MKSIDTQDDTLAVKQIYWQRGATQVPAAWHPLRTKQTKQGANTEHGLQKVQIHVQVTCAGGTNVQKIHPETM